MLETMKIEREAIQFDINSLKLVEKESKDVIDTEVCLSSFIIVLIVFAVFSCLPQNIYVIL